MITNGKLDIQWITSTSALEEVFVIFVHLPIKKNNIKKEERTLKQRSRNLFKVSKTMLEQRVSEISF